MGRGWVFAALQPDGFSRFAHIVGGLAGCAVGFFMSRKAPKKGKKK